MNHLVFMADGTKQVLTDEQLGTLEEGTWTAARNADLPRFVVNGALDPDTFAVHVTVMDTYDATGLDTDPATGQNWAGKAPADAYAAAKNASEPTIIQLYTPSEPAPPPVLEEGPQNTVPPVIYSGGVSAPEGEGLVQ